VPGSSVTPPPDDVPTDPPAADPGALPAAVERPEYGLRSLEEADLAPGWLEQFRLWFREVREFREAVSGQRPEALATAVHGMSPHAMVLATTSPVLVPPAGTSPGSPGGPSARTVLLKGVDERGLVWVSNYRSRKGRDLSAVPRAALCFPWWLLERQVIATGAVRRLDEAGSDALFAARPREAQLAAWASRQSEVVASRAALAARLDEVARRFPGRVPRPPFWGGYLLEPDSVEFWQGGAGRLHDRLRYVRHAQDGWRIERLMP
jgi:pyridoxamine 5'-phosphate oxidase